MPPRSRDHINLYGFWNETAFLTKSGDLGMVLRVTGVDYESLDHGEQEYAVKRLEAALKILRPGLPCLPVPLQNEPAGDSIRRLRRPHCADRRRTAGGSSFEEKADRLFEIEIYYCVLLEGARSKTGVSAALRRALPRSGRSRERAEGAVHQSTA